VAWGAAGALAADDPPRVGALAAAGALRLVSDADGTAILTAAGLKPGQSASGTVTLSNTGDLDGSLDLLQTALVDVPGTGGGRLSTALELEVSDVTGGPARIVYQGPLAGLGLAAVGPLRASEQRRYRLVATLPDTGVPAAPLSGDNRLQGASVRVTWTWQAAGQPPTPTPTPVASTTPAPAPVPAPLPVRGRGWAAAVLKLRIPWQRVLATRGITVVATCEEACRLRFGARLESAPRRGRRRTLQAGHVFRPAGSHRNLPAGAPRRIKLRLTPRAVRILRRELLTQGRVAVLVAANVSSPRGAATVRRRIVLVASRRAARRGGAHGG
jgi:hypothetical protein